MTARVFLRLSRVGVPDLLPAGHTFELGKANLLRDGDAVTLIANGTHHAPPGEGGGHPRRDRASRHACSTWRPCGLDRRRRPWWRPPGDTGCDPDGRGALGLSAAWARRSRKLSYHQRPHR
jgi:hypothetical protein